MTPATTTSTTISASVIPPVITDPNSTVLPLIDPNKVPVITTKKCKRCGRVLPLSHFDPHNKTRDGYHRFCRECGVRKRTTASTTPKEPEDNRPANYNPQPGQKATLSLTDFTDNNLFAELRRRGYSGDLTFSKIVTI